MCQPNPKCLPSTYLNSTTTTTDWSYLTCCWVGTVMLTAFVLQWTGNV